MGQNGDRRRRSEGGERGNARMKKGGQERYDSVSVGRATRKTWKAMDSGKKRTNRTGKRERKQPLLRAGRNPIVGNTSLEDRPSSRRKMELPGG